MCILKSENHEAFEPINISFIPAAKKATERSMAIASVYSAPEKSFIVQVKVYT